MEFSIQLNHTIAKEAKIKKEIKIWKINEKQKMHEEGLEPSSANTLRP